MAVFADAMAVLLSDPALSSAARYRRPPYVWATSDINVIVSQPVDELGRSIAGSIEVDVRAADLPDSVAQRLDEIAIAGTTYRVESATRDPLALSWRLVLGKAI